MRIIFLGTPEFAVPTLEKLLAWPAGQVVAAVCQPDRPSGRGHKLLVPPVKRLALGHGIPVLQPERLSRSPETVEAMRELSPDVLVMVAFGQILKPVVLDMAAYGVVNLHGSLLPRYRGPAPVNWAIINGETVTGVTTMFCDPGVDTGDMILKREVPVGPETTAEELARTLASVGADLVVETLEQIRAGTVKPQKQDDSRATYAPLLKKEMGRIEWSKPAWEIHNLVRGLVPWPGTYTDFAGNPLKVLKTRPAGSAGAARAVPGQVVAAGEKVIIACGQGGQEAIELLEVQPANRARLPARDWANGVRLKPGLTIGS